MDMRQRLIDIQRILKDATLRKSIEAIIYSEAEFLRNMSMRIDTRGLAELAREAEIFRSTSEYAFRYGVYENLLLANISHINKSLHTIINSETLHTKVFGNALNKILTDQHNFLNKLKPSIEYFIETEKSIREQYLNLTNSLDVAERLKKDFPGLSELFPKIYPRWEYSISELHKQMVELEFPKKRPDIYQRLLHSSSTFTDYTCYITKNLKSIKDEKSKRAIKIGILLTNDQFLEASEILFYSLELPSDNQVLTPQKTQNLYTLQQSELYKLDHLPDDEELEDGDILYGITPLTQNANLTYEMLHLIADCNNAIIDAEKEKIFATTTTTLEVTNELHRLVPINKRTFAEFIDGLFSLFYEGAGSDNLRFLNDNIINIGKDKCNLIWCIKTLRNKWLRHDPEHGSNKDIQKSRKTLRWALDWMGFTHRPRTKEEFLTAHRKLLNESIRFLRELIKKIDNEQ